MALTTCPTEPEFDVAPPLCTTTTPPLDDELPTADSGTLGIVSPLRLRLRVCVRERRKQQITAAGQDMPETKTDETFNTSSCNI